MRVARSVGLEAVQRSSGVSCPALEGQRGSWPRARVVPGKHAQRVGNPSSRRSLAVSAQYASNVARAPSPIQPPSPPPRRGRRRPPRLSRPLFSSPWLSSIGRAARRGPRSAPGRRRRSRLLRREEGMAAPRIHARFWRDDAAESEERRTPWRQLGAVTEPLGHADGSLTFSATRRPPSRARPCPASWGELAPESPTPRANRPRSSRIERNGSSLGLATSGPRAPRRELAFADPPRRSRRRGVATTRARPAARVRVGAVLLVRAEHHHGEGRRGRRLGGGRRLGIGNGARGGCVRGAASSARAGAPARGRERARAAARARARRGLRVAMVVGHARVELQDVRDDVVSSEQKLSDEISRAVARDARFLGRRRRCALALCSYILVWANGHRGKKKFRSTVTPDPSARSCPPHRRAESRPWSSTSPRSRRRPRCRTARRGRCCPRRAARVRRSRAPATSG